MNEGKRLCPICKAWTMEPAEGILVSPEEYERVEPGPPLIFEGRIAPYHCPVCKHIGFEPVEANQ
jgi:hypothetical protein